MRIAVLATDSSPLQITCPYHRSLASCILLSPIRRRTSSFITRSCWVRPTLHHRILISILCRACCHSVEGLFRFDVAMRYNHQILQSEHHPACYWRLPPLAEVPKVQRFADAATRRRWWVSDGLVTPPELQKNCSICHPRMRNELRIPAWKMECENLMHKCSHGVCFLTVYSFHSYHMQFINTTSLTASISRLLFLRCHKVMFPLYLY